MADAPTSHSGNVFMRKLGPLPMWGWMGIALLLAILYYMYDKDKSSSTAANTSTASSATGTTTETTDQSLIPQFVNQVYTEVSPPNVTATSSSTSSSTSTTPTTTATTTPTPATVNQYAAPTGLSAKAASPTSLSVTWADLTGVTPAPSSYTVAIYSSAGKLLSQQTVTAPDTTGGNSTATITGLPSGSSNLQVHVWANGGTQAPPHAATTVSL